MLRVKNEHVSSVHSTAHGLFVQTGNRLYIYDVENEKGHHELRHIVELGVTSAQRNSATYKCKSMILDKAGLYSIHVCEDSLNYLT